MNFFKNSKVGLLLPFNIRSGLTYNINLIQQPRSIVTISSVKNIRLSNKFNNSKLALNNKNSIYREYCDLKDKSNIEKQQQKEIDKQLDSNWQLCLQKKEKENKQLNNIDILFNIIKLILLAPFIIITILAIINGWILVAELICLIITGEFLFRS